MAGPHLIYVADPMCSWCWGFSPVIDAIAARFGADLPIRVLMGGLRPGTREPMDDAKKAMIRSHWEHVAVASGQPFDMAFFARDGFVYDTEPAARALVVVRREGMDRAVAFLKQVQHAFYALNRDVTDAQVLADLAEMVGVERDPFLAGFASEEARQETWSDFAIAQKSGITGFPTLLAGDGAGPYAMVTQGYQPPDKIVPLLEQWVSASAPA